MEDFKNRFIEDALELLLTLEKNLLDLEKKPDSRELIQDIFRAMHTLKGSSGMYGFNKVGEITHHLESVFDFIRSDNYELTPTIISLTLHSVDHIRNLLQKTKLTETDLRNHDSFIAQVLRIITQMQGDVNLNGAQQPPDYIEDSIAQRQVATYYILFQPDNTYVIRNINLQAIFNELTTLGKCSLIPRTRTTPESAPEKYILFWEIFITTAASLDDLQGVFLFLEDETQVSLLSVNNLFESLEFIQCLETYSEESTPKSINDLQEWIKPIENKFKKVSKELSIEPSELMVDHRANSIRVSSDKLDLLINIVSEMVIKQAELNLVANKKKMPELARLSESIEKLTRQLRDNALSIRLVPIENLMHGLRRLVHDVSADLKKEIEFITEGTDSELDKTIIEGLESPLMHILRNSIDHGIENANDRLKKNKPPQGIIRLTAYTVGANVVIEIADDGAGINTDKVLEKAIEKGFVAPDAQLTKRQIVDLIYHPGFTTANGVSEVSGRGVGMDVVKRKINEIRGELSIETQRDVGTTITIRLPQTLSILDALLIRVEDTYFFIPLGVVVNCAEVKTATLKSYSNKQLVLNGELILFINLRQAFNIQGNEPVIARTVLVKHESTRCALVVDEIIGEQQAVIKPLGEVFKNQQIISGASILGDGNVALIINTSKLISG